ncbi:hypothetical protein [Agathobaculum sp.]|uniref:hypothetical protein n=1 Tax=Agathobaculum sp. TaxID=2048138 RepID=UPI002A8059C8|nr:hypothetical protein [Agathobaculum sp.]MDY3618117.1 hypothetical protein [Agathobaculum sp.]
MNARDIARGGLLAAAAVALLWVGSLSPWMGPAACILAGVSAAVPLLKHGKVKASVLLYLASAVLAALIVPRKGLVAAYIAFTGLYPIVKYGIECRLPRKTQLFFKLLYFNLLLAAVAGAVAFGLFPQFAMPGTARLVMGWLIANAVFLVYDGGLSRLIALLTRTLPPL